MKKIFAVLAIGAAALVAPATAHATAAPSMTIGAVCVSGKPRITVWVHNAYLEGGTIGVNTHIGSTTIGYNTTAVPRATPTYGLVVNWQENHPGAYATGFYINAGGAVKATSPTVALPVC